MKKSLVLAGIIFASSSVYAANIDYFVAVGGGQGYETVKIDVAGFSKSTNDNGGAFSVDGGILINDTHRIGLEYSKYNTSGNSSLVSIALGYDYRIHIKESKFKPYLGLSYMRLVDLENTTNNATVTYDQSNFELDTNAIMGRIGVDYDINTNFYASAMCDYAFNTSGSTNLGFTTSGTHYNANVEVDKLNRFQLLVGYKF
ncbi:outer membrane beta-barrel protein [Sulfurimonas sp.]